MSVRSCSSSSTRRIVSVPRLDVSGGGARRPRLGGRGAGQVDLEGRPLSPARCRPRCGRLLCLTIPNTVESPSPVPLPTSLVVKKGSKMRASVARSIPHARVGHGEHDVGPGPDAVVRLRVVLVELRRSPSRSSACRPCGIASRALTDEVHHDLLDLARVGQHLARLRGTTGSSARRRRPRRRWSIFSMPATTLLRSKTFGSTTWCRLNSSSCRVSSAALSPAVRDLEHVGAHRVRRPSESREHQVAVAQDHGQDVVEVVRDPACQPADGLHLLRLAELLLGLAQRVLGAQSHRDVVDQNEPRRTVLELEVVSLRLHEDDAAVLLAMTDDTLARREPTLLVHTPTVLVELDVPDRQRVELLPAVTVVMDRGLVDVEKPECLPVR